MFVSLWNLAGGSGQQQSCWATCQISEQIQSSNDKSSLLKFCKILWYDFLCDTESESLIGGKEFGSWGESARIPYHDDQAIRYKVFDTHNKFMGDFTPTCKRCQYKDALSINMMAIFLTMAFCIHLETYIATWSYIYIYIHVCHLIIDYQETTQSSQTVLIFV